MAGKAVAAGAAVVLLGAARWFAFREGGAPSAPIVSHDDTVAKAPPPPTPVAEKEPAPAVSDPPSLPPPVDLSKCDRALDLFGVVVDGKGAPIPGARLRPLDRPWRRAAPAFLPEFAQTEAGEETLSASDGTFRLRLGRDDVVDLEVTATGHPVLVLPDCPAGERLRVVLAKGARLVVDVKDGAGDPLSGIAVEVSGVSRGFAPRIIEEGLTGADGRCAFPGLPAGQAIVTAGSERLTGTRMFTTLEEGVETMIELSLPAGRTVAGRVLDGATKAPVAGARVGAGSLLAWAVSTDAEGRFTLAGWPKTDEKSIYARADGFAATTLVPPPGGEVEILLWPGDRVIGRVVDGAGLPVAEARILLLGATEDPGRLQRVDFLLTTTGADGGFECSGLMHDFSHLLMVNAPGHARLGMEVPPPDGPPGGTRDLGTLRLGPPQVMAGRVLDGRGEPSAGIEVRAHPAEGKGGRMPPVPERRRTDDLGRFRFPGVGPGAWRLDARVEGMPPLVAEVALPPGEDLLDLVLQAAPLPGGSTDFTVRVLGPGGEPVKGVGVFVQAGPTALRRQTGAEGTAVFQSLPGTTAMIYMTVPQSMTKAPEYLQQEPIEARLADGELVVRLVPTARIRGRVLGPDGSPLAGMMVQAEGPPGIPGGSSHTDDRGEFTLGVAAGGPYRITIPGFRLDGSDATTYAPARSPYRADPQEVTAPVEGLVFNMREVRSGMTLTVRIVDAEGRGVPNIAVTGSPVKAGEGIPATGEDGRVVLKDLPEEEARFIPVAGGGSMGGPPVVPDGFVVPEPFTAVPQGQEVVLALRKGEEVRGRVLDSEGRPAVMAWVQVQTDDLVLSQAWSGPDGRFTIWLSPGRKRQMIAATLIEPGKGVREQVVLRDPDLPREGEIEIRTKPVETR